VLLFIEISLHELLKVLQAHVPCLALLLAHQLVALSADSTLDVVFEAIIEECGATETACAYSAFFDTKRFQLGDFVRYEIYGTAACERLAEVSQMCK